MLGRGRVLYYTAFVWRRLMLRTTVIAITGSVGKSTAKECLAAMLATQEKTLKTNNNENGLISVPLTLWRLRPWHRYAVIEIGTERPGQIRRSALLVKPDIAIVLTVARTHTNSFPTLDDTAREKGGADWAATSGGIAILNGDVERVRGMAEGSGAKVIFFGQTGDCDLVAEDVSSAWPERLHFTLRSGGEELPVRTQLVGTHWLGSALGALAAAQACGVSLTAAVAALEGVAPFVARMQPVAHPSGAVVIRDEETSSVDSVEAMFKVLRESRAQRRILVFGDVTDVKRNTRQRLREIGKIAAELTDVAVFFGEHGHHGVRGAVNAGMDPARCHEIIGLQSAAEFLKQELRAGDLVFVKGRAPDHLSRIVFAQYGEIGCWVTSCRMRRCAICAPGSSQSSTSRKCYQRRSRFRRL